MATTGDPDDVRPYASPACFLHELDPAYLGFSLEVTAEPARPRAARLMPGRPFPPYAYLPGRFPHPIRDPRGHSYKAEPVFLAAKAGIDPDALFWGMDLFNHGYYWEAHEAWEDLWRATPKATPQRAILHGLILLAAAGVKLREGKLQAARRHGERAAGCFRSALSEGVVAEPFQPPLDTLALLAEQAVRAPKIDGDPAVVFDFELGSPVSR